MEFYELSVMPPNGEAVATIMHPKKLFCLLFAVLSFGPLGKAELAPYPLADLVAITKSNLVDHSIIPTGFKKEDYIETISGIVNFFHHFQAEDGRIIDPYLQKEFQYATPCYAWAATSLIGSGKQTNLVESAAKALENAVHQLAENKANMRHGDFFTFPCMMAYEHLRERIPAEQRQRIEADLRRMDAEQCYSDVMHKGDGQVHNWNIVAMSGEFLRAQDGFTNNVFVEKYLKLQFPYFTSMGLYQDPHTPMAYDHFPRHFLAAMLERGYKGEHFKDLNELIDRGAQTSLLMQSPTGELSTGGRSAQHQWNEAEQCVSYEIWANRSKRNGDNVSAGAFKRAAHLALQSIQRWVRPSGELSIVKNHFDPASRHGFEHYSSHSQYNLLAASMMATAWTFADDTISESACPADVGGFAFEAPEFHKIFANADGLYIEIDTAAYPDYNSTGLIRVHKAGVEPLVGPSDVPPANDFPMATGVAWKGTNRWESLAGWPRERISKIEFQPLMTKTNQVKFSVTYTVDGASIQSLTEIYALDGKEVDVTTTIHGKTAQTKVQFPAFVFDGANASIIGISNSVATVTLNNSRQTFSVASKLAEPLHRSGQLIATRNGFVEAIEAEMKGKTVHYCLRPERLLEKTLK